MERVAQIKDLVVLTTSTLYPGAHVQKVCTKANSVLGFIASVSRDCLSLPTLETLYIVFVRSQLEYGSSIWSSYQVGLIKSLERVHTLFYNVWE